jgi:acetyl esterase/lipase
VDLDALIAELEREAETRGPAPRIVRYGTDSQQFAEFRYPVAAGTPPPVAVLLHGGFWRAPYTLTLMGALAADLAAHGWASWNVEYRRGGSGGGVPETLDDTAAAIAALIALEAPIDRSSLTVIGHSAGGQLALWAAGLPSVRHIISLAGVCDLYAAEREGIGSGAAVEFLGGTSKQRPQQYAAADPLSRLPVDARLLLVHGDADDRVPVQQSRSYQCAAGENCELLELAGVGHFELIDPRTEAWAQIRSRLVATPTSA